MNPADLNNLPEEDKNELLSMIDAMQTRDRRARARARRTTTGTSPSAPPGRKTTARYACPAAPRTPAAPTASLRMYNNLVERCFVQCVDSFRCARRRLQSHRATQLCVPSPPP